MISLNFMDMFPVNHGISWICSHSTIDFHTFPMEMLPFFRWDGQVLMGGSFGTTSPWGDLTSGFWGDTPINNGRNMVDLWSIYGMFSWFSDDFPRFIEHLLGFSHDFPMIFPWKPPFDGDSSRWVGPTESSTLGSSRVLANAPGQELGIWRWAKDCCLFVDTKGFKHV